MDTELIVTICTLLGRLGLTANYSGYFYTVYAILLVHEQPERLLLVTKWLYPDIGTQFHTTWRNVERNIRTAVALVWKRNPTLLSQLAGYPLQEKPNVAQFLAILNAHLFQNPAA